MTFASPELLVALLLVPLAIAAYLFVHRRRSRYVVRFTNVDLLSNLAPRVPAWRRHVPVVFYVAAISALVIALARPSMVMAIPREEATIVQPLRKQPYGNWEFEVRDPNGYLLVFSERA